MQAWESTEIWYHTYTSLRQTLWYLSGKKMTRKKENNFKSFGLFHLPLHSLSRRAGGPEASSHLCCSCGLSQFSSASSHMSGTLAPKISVFIQHGPNNCRPATSTGAHTGDLFPHGQESTARMMDLTMLVFNTAPSSGLQEELCLHSIFTSILIL